MCNVSVLSEIGTPERREIKGRRSVKRVTGRV